MFLFNIRAMNFPPCSCTSQSPICKNATQPKRIEKKKKIIKFNILSQHKIFNYFKFFFWIYTFHIDIYIIVYYNVNAESKPNSLVNVLHTIKSERPYAVRNHCHCLVLISIYNPKFSTGVIINSHTNSRCQAPLYKSRSFKKKNKTKDEQNCEAFSMIFFLYSSFPITPQSLYLQILEKERKNYTKVICSSEEPTLYFLSTNHRLLLHDHH